VKFKISPSNFWPI